MKLETLRLVLSPIRHEDVQRIHKFHSIKEVAEFNTLGVPLDISVTEKLLKNVLSSSSNEFGWTITLKDNDKFIGELGLGVSPDLDHGEIHYALIPTRWGRGYATEAIKEVISFGFTKLHLQKIEANTATENIRSIKVLEQVGMIKESIQKTTLLIGNNWKDNYTFSMVSPFIDSAYPSDPPAT